jgi:hypothetical protein
MKGPVETDRERKTAVIKAARWSARVLGAVTAGFSLPERPGWKRPKAAL